MKCNQAGVNIIKKYESLKLHAYYCPAHILTIGYGHTGQDVKSGMQISEHMAELLLKNDLERFEKEILALLKVPVTENQFSALVSFTFNVGSGNFAGSSMLKYINQNFMALASLEFDRWTRANGRVLAGLTKRRAEEKQLFLT